MTDFAPKRTSRPHVIRGRDTPVAALSVTLDRVRRSAASAVVLVEGGAGIGKTRLLDEAVRMAGRVGFTAGRGKGGAAPQGGGGEGGGAEGFRGWEEGGRAGGGRGVGGCKGAVFWGRA